MAAQIRFLQKQGIDLASAVASGGLLANVGNIFACTILLIVATILSPTSIVTEDISVDSFIPIILIIIFGSLVLSAFIFGIPDFANMSCLPSKMLLPLCERR